MGSSFFAFAAILQDASLVLFSLSPIPSTIRSCSLSTILSCRFFPLDFFLVSSLSLDHACHVFDQSNDLIHPKRTNNKTTIFPPHNPTVPVSASISSDYQRPTLYPPTPTSCQTHRRVGRHGSLKTVRVPGRRHRLWPLPPTVTTNGWWGWQPNDRR